MKSGHLAPYLNRMEYVPRELASIRQPHWHRHLAVKRPTLSCDARRVVRSQSAVCRLHAHVISVSGVSQEKSAPGSQASQIRTCTGGGEGADRTWVTEQRDKNEGT